MKVDVGQHGGRQHPHMADALEHEPAPLVPAGPEVAEELEDPSGPPRPDRIVGEQVHHGRDGVAAVLGGVLDVLGIEVAPAQDDQVLEAAGDEELAAVDEAVVLEGEDDEWGEVVVDLGDVHVAGAHAGLRPEAGAEELRRGVDVLAVGGVGELGGGFDDG